MARNLDDVSRALAAEQPEESVDSWAVRSPPSGWARRRLSVWTPVSPRLRSSLRRSARVVSCCAGPRAATSRSIRITVVPAAMSARAGAAAATACAWTASAVPPAVRADKSCAAASASTSQTTPAIAGIAQPCAADQVCVGGTCQDGPPPPECSSLADCGQATACQSFTCNAGHCGTVNVEAGTAVGTQVIGDCQKIVCDGNGNFVSVSGDSDTPDDGNECTMDVCAAGVPSNPAAPAGTPCTNGVCDGSGVCVTI